MARGPTQLTGHAVGQRLREALPEIVEDATAEWVVVEPARIIEALRWLHDDPQLDAAQLSSLCGVDRYTHFEVVYHLQSLDQNHQMVLKVRTPDRAEPTVPSACAVYRGALLQERETYDLLGIHFAGHPDLRRLLLWEGYPGWPLRKDFLQLTGHHPGLPQFPFEQPGQQAR